MWKMCEQGSFLLPSPKMSLHMMQVSAASNSSLVASGNLKDSHHTITNDNPTNNHPDTYKGIRKTYR